MCIRVVVCGGGVVGVVVCGVVAAVGDVGVYVRVVGADGVVAGGVDGVVGVAVVVVVMVVVLVLVLWSWWSSLFAVLLLLLFGGVLVLICCALMCGWLFVCVHGVGVAAISSMLQRRL